MHLVVARGLGQLEQPLDQRLVAIGVERMFEVFEQEPPRGGPAVAVPSRGEARQGFRIVKGTQPLDERPGRPARAAPRAPANPPSPVTCPCAAPPRGYALVVYPRLRAPPRSSQRLGCAGTQYPTSLLSEAVQNGSELPFCDPRPPRAAGPRVSVVGGGGRDPAAADRGGDLIPADLARASQPAGGAARRCGRRGAASAAIRRPISDRLKKRCSNQEKNRCSIRSCPRTFSGNCLRPARPRPSGAVAGARWGWEGRSQPL